MLSCREIAFIIPDDDWSIKQRIELKVHLLMCSKCRKLVEQFKIVEHGLIRIIEQAPSLSPELAQKIAKNYIESN